MSSFVDRLRGVLRPHLGAETQPPASSDPDESSPAPLEDDLSEVCSTGSRAPSTTASRDRARVAEVLGGEWRDAGNQAYLVVDRTYGPGFRHGRMSIADALPPTTGSWPGLSLLIDAESAAPAGPPVPAHRLLFIDLETTGLAGGAGTYAFLVGLGWFDGARFRTRQFFLSDFRAERALLDGVRDTAMSAAALATYNGKTFDVPLIETRFAMHRMRGAFGDLPHLDMLHHARRFWRAESSGDEAWRPESTSQARSCRLLDVERTVCGHTRDHDVPGFDIPSRYFHYVRSGDARLLEGVLEHNRLDLLSLALITTHLVRLLEDGPSAARTAREALGLGRLHERRGSFEVAGLAYAVAGGLVASHPLRRDLVAQAEALRAYAVLARRRRQFDAAADAWNRLLDLSGCPLPLVREATEALAVHHEHRVRDLSTARRLALQSLQFSSSASRQHAVRHRLARLEHKLGRGQQATPLF